MLTKFSKSSADIAPEESDRLQADPHLAKRQNAALERLRDTPPRESCLLCGNALRGETFTHRSIPFVICHVCDHIQTAGTIPPGYPGIDFHTVYPELDRDAYQSRRTRIYYPKLQWILDSLIGLGRTAEQIRSYRWLEFGSGSGCFLSALEEFGVKSYRGLEANEALVATGNRHIKSDRLLLFNNSLVDGLEKHRADIYVAFFVLEHLEYTHHLLLALKQLSPETVFVFSVPVFGLSSLLENCFPHNFARNLDGVLHTQVYTDKSIQYAMAMADFTIEAEWIFGQDATDFTRFVTTNLVGRYPASLRKTIAAKLHPIEDCLQTCVDRALLADQRHVLAVKN